MQKSVSSKPKRITINGLAMMTARGFEDVEECLGERMDRGFERVEKAVAGGFQSVNARLDEIRGDIADLDDLRERVTTIEAHIGLPRKK